VSDLQPLPDGQGLSFTHLSPALPWVVPETGSEEKLKWESVKPAALGMALTHAGHRLGSERLKISGLEPGLYDIRIDGRSIGKPVPHTALAAKIELQGNAATPQYAQAMQVALLNRERNDKAIRPLRDAWGRIKGLRKQLDTAKPETRERIEKEIAGTKDLIALGRQYEERLHAAAVPVARRYEVRLLPPPAPKKAGK
jgi:hypothetical protein